MAHRLQAGAGGLCRRGEARGARIGLDQIPIEPSRKGRGQREREKSEKVGHDHSLPNPNPNASRYDITTVREEPRRVAHPHTLGKENCPIFIYIFHKVEQGTSLKNSTTRFRRSGLTCTLVQHNVRPRPRCPLPVSLRDVLMYVYIQAHLLIVMCIGAHCNIAGAATVSRSQSHNASGQRSLKMLHRIPARAACGSQHKSETHAREHTHTHIREPRPSALGSWMHITFYTRFNICMYI